MVGIQSCWTLRWENILRLSIEVTKMKFVGLKQRQEGEGRFETPILEDLTGTRHLRLTSSLLIAV